MCCPHSYTAGRSPDESVSKEFLGGQEARFIQGIFSDQLVYDWTGEGLENRNPEEEEIGGTKIIPTKLFDKGCMLKISFRGGQNNVNFTFLT